MTPFPNKPTVVVLTDKNGKVAAVASNLAAFDPEGANPDRLAVVLTDNVNVFNANSDNKPFNSTLPEQPVQVLAMRKS